MSKNNSHIKRTIDVQFYPIPEFVEMKLDLDKTKKFSLEQLLGLGKAFEPVFEQVNNAKTKSGQSGIYYVKTTGKEMFKSGNDFIGTLKADDGGVGGGLARMQQIPIDPATMFMAVALMSVEMKLDSIQELQKEILAFLELKEEAKLKGNLKTLSDVLDNYKFNWNNEKYKNSKYIIVQDIKREAEQSIILYSEQLRKLLGRRSKFGAGQDVKTILNKSLAYFNDYQLALYVFSFSSFLEVMLLENFDTEFLNSVRGKISEYSNAYSALYNQCSKRIELGSKSAIEGYVLKGMSKLSSGAGKLAGKAPVIKKSQLDGNLLKASNYLDELNIGRTENVMRVLSNSQVDYISPFIDNIETIDILYNQPVQLMFDTENIYVARLPAAEKQL